jgi:hypothetical protein
VTDNELIHHLELLRGHYLICRLRGTDREWELRFTPEKWAEVDAAIASGKFQSVVREHQNIVAREAPELCSPILGVELPAESAEHKAMAPEDIGKFHPAHAALTAKIKMMRAGARNPPFSSNHAAPTATERPTFRRWDAELGAVVWRLQQLRTLPMGVPGTIAEKRQLVEECNRLAGEIEAPATLALPKFAAAEDPLRNLASALRRAAAAADTVFLNDGGLRPDIDAQARILSGFHPWIQQQAATIEGPPPTSPPADNPASAPPVVGKGEHAQNGRNTPADVQQAPPPRAHLTPPEPPRPYHSDDFRSVNWFGTQHSFTPQQAAVVRVLWAEWEKPGKLPLSNEEIRRKVDSNAERLKVNDVFRNNRDGKTVRHPALGSMIQATEDNLYYLSSPEKHATESP